MKNLAGSVIFLVCLVFATSASALMWSQVGVLDTLQGSANLGNSGPDEAEFLATSWGLDPSTFEYSKNDSTAGDWTLIEGTTSTWAYDFGDDFNSSVFYIKTGNFGLINGITHTFYDTYWFENNDQLNYAVIDLSQFAKINSRDRYLGEIVGVGGISHIGAPVPEPSTILLLGIGLLGLAWYRRKRNQA